MHARIRRRAVPDIWPGFVDAISALLIIILFLLMVFTLAQHFLSEILTGRNEALSRLNKQVAELSELLALEQQSNAGLRDEIGQLSAELQSSVTRRDALSAQLAAALSDKERLAAALAESQEKTAKASPALADACKSTEAARAKIKTQLGQLELLRRDIAALKELRAKLEKEVTTKAAALKSSEESLTALRDESKALEAKLSTEKERTALAQKKVTENELLLTRMTERATGAEETLDAEKKLSAEARARVELLNRQITALRQQLAKISAVLQASEAKSREQQVQIANLGKRLNAALASKVQELARYRSEFFGRLREVIGNRRDVRIVGDRFVFQSEVLFDSASSQIKGGGERQIAALARTLTEIAGKIPANIDWVLRVDGHTDKLPIRTGQFPSNWELSTARAVSVVKLLIANGLPADRLVAAGFGEFHPIDKSNTPGALRRNRRIEFKLTNR